MSDLINKKAILVINKSDLGTDQIHDQLDKYDPVYFYKIGKNLDKLVNIIKKNLKNKFISSNDIFITRKDIELILKSVFNN